MGLCAFLTLATIFIIQRSSLTDCYTDCGKSIFRWLLPSVFLDENTDKMGSGPSKSFVYTYDDKQVLGERPLSHQVGAISRMMELNSMPDLLYSFDSLPLLQSESYFRPFLQTTPFPSIPTNQKFAAESRLKYLRPHGVTSPLACRGLPFSLKALIIHPVQSSIGSQGWFEP